LSHFLDSYIVEFDVWLFVQVTSEHLSLLLFLTDEGPAIPHPRNTDEDEQHHAKFETFVSEVYRQYMKFPHRT